MAQMPFAEDNDMIETLPPDGSDETFTVPVLPRGTWGSWSISNAHRAQSALEDLAIGAIPVTDGTLAPGPNQLPRSAAARSTQLMDVLLSPAEGCCAGRRSSPQVRIAS